MAKKKLIKVTIKNPYKQQKIAYKSREKEIAERIENKQKFLKEQLEIKKDEQDD
jgi:hypothetical protein